MARRQGRGRPDLPAADRSLLRRLDDVAVPALQRALRAIGRGLGAPLASLNRLEERLAGGAVFRALWPRRQYMLLSIAVLVFVGAYVHLLWYPETREQDPGTFAAEGLDEGEGHGQSDLETSPAVGPVIGQDLDEYVTERLEVLATAEDDGENRAAIVSFSSYVTVAEAVTLVPDGFEITLVQIRVPAENEDPVEVVTDGEVEADVSAVIKQERDRIADEEDEFRRLLDSGTVTDPDFKELYENEVERLSSTRHLLDSGAATVFAVVVEGSLDELRLLAEQDGIRLVDIAPAGESIDDLRFYGLLPDDSDAASYGRFR
jgi:hypothetical protein